MPLHIDAHTLRRRVILLVLTDFLWGMGWYFVSFTTTIPAYLRALGAPTIVIGVMATSMGALPLVFPLFGRATIQRFPRRKLGVILLHLTFILPYFLVAAADLAYARTAPHLVVLFLLAVLACSQIILGLILPVWLDMVAQIIPAKMHGRYFGLTSGAFAAGGILGGVGLTLLQRVAGRAVFREAFCVAGSFFLLSMVAFALTPIPESAFDHPPEPSLLVRMRKACSAVHPRTNFGRFAVSYGVQILAISSVAFLADYASSGRGLHYPSAIFSTINLYQAIGGTMGALLLGSLVDRIGPRWPWVGLTCIVPLLALLMPFGGHLPVLLLCALLSGLLITHWSVGAPALLELSPPGDKSGYIAIANMLALPSSVCGPLLIAHLIDGNSYSAGFLLAAFAGVLALCAALTIRPRSAATVAPARVVETEQL